MTDNQETDVWWGSYAGRAMLPHFVLAGLVTLLIGAMAWYAWDTQIASWPITRYTAYGLSAIVWSIEIGLWVYRMVWWNYRLTTRRLYRAPGFRRKADVHVELADVIEAGVEQNSFEKRLGIGCVWVRTSKGLPLLLDAVHEPEVVAAKIREYAAAALNGK